MCGKPVEFVHLFIRIVGVLAENQMTHSRGLKFLKSDHKHMSRAKVTEGKPSMRTHSRGLCLGDSSRCYDKKCKAVCLEGLLSSSRDIMAAALRQPVTVHPHSGNGVVRAGAQCTSPFQSGTPA